MYKGMYYAFLNRCREKLESEIPSGVMVCGPEFGWTSKVYGGAHCSVLLFVCLFGVIGNLEAAGVV